MLKNQQKKGEETKRSSRIKLKRDREEDEEEDGRWCRPPGSDSLKVHPASCSHLSRPGLSPLMSTSHVVHTAKWSLTNLFHYGNDLHDWTPREPESVQDWFHSTAINSLPMDPLRSDQREKRLWRRHKPTIDHSTSTTTENPIQAVSIQLNSGAPKTSKVSAEDQQFKVLLLFFPTHHCSYTLLHLVDFPPSLIQTAKSPERVFKGKKNMCHVGSVLNQFGSLNIYWIWLQNLNSAKKRNQSLGM